MPNPTDTSERQRPSIDEVTEQLEAFTGKLSREGLVTFLRLIKAVGEAKTAVLERCLRELLDTEPDAFRALNES